MVSCPECEREDGRSCSICFKCFCECDPNEPEHVFKYTQAMTTAREASSQFAAAYDRVVAEKHELQEKLRIAEAVRDDARATSARDLERRRAAESVKAGVDAEGAADLIVYAKKRGWADGVQACIDMVKRRHDHFELYRCDCGAAEAVPTPVLHARIVTGGQQHKPGCKGEAMSTHPATFAILEEMLVFLSALKERGPS
jgi:hypothetical protein